ncbi:hypothetical protein CRG98_015317 [Punica granatum]|uniref:Uncharacterized protein n=1 Tax=Punica granatum TaxID=22663 RepID=A0A2I0K6V7_PUNGR|nr:hypothetical protein CRG98_015317 [Punica granatum]
MERDHECQKAFDTIKAYLIQPPILVPPVSNRPLILYLTVRRQSLRCMLGQEDESTLSEPYFGPPASHTRIPDRSPGHYSSPGNQRQIGGHGVMSNRRKS